MNTTTAKSLQKLLKLGIFKTADAVNLGISQPTISRLATEGLVNRLDHGIYCDPKIEFDPVELDFAIACLRMGEKSYISGLSALFFYVLIPQVPQTTWVVYPNNESKYRYAQYTIIQTTLSCKIGIEDKKIYRIASIERAIVDAFKYSTKIGLQTAINACRIAIRESKTTEAELIDVAKKLKVEHLIIKHWEAITAI